MSTSGTATFSEVVRGLHEHAGARPDEDAVRDVGPGGKVETYGWGRLLGAVTGLAHRLESQEPPGPVLVCGGSGFELLVAILAGLHADRWVAPCARESTPHELRALAREAGARVAIGGAAAREALADEVDATIDLAEAAGGERSNTVRGTGQGSVLLRSSGTTGPPKLVRRSAAALDAVGRGCRGAMGLDAGDSIGLAIPVYHSYGIDMAVLTAMQSGAALELFEAFDPAVVRARVRNGWISCLPAVPLILHALARGGPPASTGRLRQVISAGSPLPPDVASSFEAAFGVPVCQIYGATEFGSVAFNGPALWSGEDDPYRPECVGWAFPGSEIRVVRGDDPNDPVSPGEEGQLAVSSPSLLDEYVGSDEAPTRGGFFLTGDLGRQDDRGLLELTGRLKLMVDVGGLKVNPLEVEAVLVEHPGVREAVVVPAAYTDTAWRLKAFVVPEDGPEPTREELRDFLQERLIHYKVPRSFEVTREVPRSPTGKILRQQLLAAAGGEGGAR